VDEKEEKKAEPRGEGGVGAKKSKQRLRSHLAPLHGDFGHGHAELLRQLHRFHVKRPPRQVQPPCRGEGGGGGGNQHRHTHNHHPQAHPKHTHINEDTHAGAGQKAKPTFD
jgi:hypothetical protein